MNGYQDLVGFDHGNYEFYDGGFNDDYGHIESWDNTVFEPLRQFVIGVDDWKLTIAEAECDFAQPELRNTLRVIISPLLDLIMERVNLKPCSYCFMWGERRLCLDHIYEFMQRGSV